MNCAVTRRMAVAALVVLIQGGCGTKEQPVPAPTSAPATTSAAAATTSTAGATTTVAPAITSVPLGDGRRSTSAQAGSVYSCQTSFGAGGGAFRDGPWIRADGTWDPTAKVHVAGDVGWPQAQYSVRIEGDTRVITTNAVPSQQTTGVFPVAASDPAYQYDRNPNTITPRTVTFRLPAQPTAAPSAACVGMGAIGVLSDGVVLFNALDALGRDAAAHEVLDHCDGHPERTGQYHHHTVPACVLDKPAATPTLVGYAIDGFGIYVERKADGSLFRNGDLDDCHGRVGPVDWDGRRVEIFHYVATPEYPYTVGCYRGTATARP